ncbi:MAG TPA: hypothetical protein VGG28_25390 [Kofleriaceae bacterium]|jgi:hypothetical protein
MRIALGIALAFAGCKQQPKPDPTPAPSGSAQVGHAKIHMHGSNTPDIPDSPEPAGSATATASAGSGSDESDGVPGKPAYRDDSGQVHGPGGPVDMGESNPCDASRNHCMRKPAWFSAAEIERKAQFRATPVFLFEKGWYDWRGEAIDKGGKLYSTRVAGNDPIAAGTKVIFFEADTDDSKFADSEFEALTSSRWDAGVVESSSGSNVRVSSWGDIPKDTVRLIVETKSY